MVIRVSALQQPVTRTAEMADMEGRDAVEKAFRERALTELVDCIMRGDEFPKGVHKMQQINLVDILYDCDTEVLVDIILKAKNQTFYHCEDQLRQLVRSYVNESAWHILMMEKLARDENE